MTENDINSLPVPKGKVLVFNTETNSYKYINKPRIPKKKPRMLKERDYSIRVMKKNTKSGGMSIHGLDSKRNSFTKKFN